MVLFDRVRSRGEQTPLRRFSLLFNLALQASLFYKLAYFAGNAIIIGILYAVKASALYLPLAPGQSAETTPRVTDKTVEGWLWLCIVLSWIAYLAVQGSSPGYVEVGNSE
jgi:hypothetical protein